jgi:hypothetical protein
MPLVDDEAPRWKPFLSAVAKKKTTSHHHYYTIIYY